VSGNEAKKRIADLLEVVALTDAADRSIKGYSGGMKRRLDLACALVHRPRIIFLDEPTTGLDPVTRDAVWRYIVELNKDGVTFFLTTQYLEEADRLAHCVAIMDSGKIIASGAPEQLKSSIGSDAITLVFDGGATAQAEAEPLLRRFEGVEDVRQTERETIVYMQNASGAVAEMLRQLDEAGVRVARLGLTHPTLDDVFLRATGHHLEVSESTAAAAQAAAGGGA
jgi:ABC-2 type transport system ATP-binding protein